MAWNCKQDDKKNRTINNWLKKTDRIFEKTNGSDRFMFEQILSIFISF